LALEALGFLL